MVRGHIHRRDRITRDGSVGTRWYVVLDEGKHADGRRRQRWHGGFLTQREAVLARASLIGEGLSLFRPGTDEPTFAQWVLETWLPLTATRVKPTTFESYRRNVELHVLPVIGGRPMREISGSELTALYARLLVGGGAGRPLSPKTVRYIHMTIHKALADAVDGGNLDENVAARAKPPRPVGCQVSASQIWSASALAQFLRHARSDRLGAIWRLAAMTGMRRGEVLGLRWSDVDFDGTRLSVRRARVALGSRVIESTPKGGGGRTIDLDDQTTEQLWAHHRRQLHERTTCDDSDRGQDAVARSPTGEAIHPDAFSRGFRRLVAQAGLPRIRLHDLRHTHASLALGAGVPVKVVSERLGHASAAFTLTVYAHVLPGMQAAAAAEVADLIAREPRRAHEASHASARRHCRQQWNRLT